MIRLPAPRLLPITIVMTALLLGLKSLSLGQAALASDPSGGQAVEAQTGQHAPPVSSAAIAPSSLDLEASRHERSPFAQTSPPVPIAIPPDWPLLQDLRQRREALEGREHALDLKDAALQAAERTLQNQLTDLRSLKGELQSLEAARQQRTDKGWSGIVKLYEVMRPADAAVIFDALDVHLLVQILDRMNERRAALIMGSMEPERARLATQLLAVYRQRRDADPIATASPDPSIKSPGAG